MVLRTIFDEANDTQVIYQENEANKRYEIFLKNGSLSKLRIFYEDGQLNSELTLVNGKVDLFMTYHRNTCDIYSKVIDCILTPNDNYILDQCKMFYPEGAPKFEGVMIDQKKSGFCTDYYPDGSKQYEANWENGQKNGKGTLYWKNSNTKYDGFFKDDKYYGKGSLFHENGTLSYNGEFINDKKQGEIISYHSNSNIEFSGTIMNGKKIGFGTSYYSNGNKKYAGDWFDDGYTNEGKWYNSEEVLLMEGKFSNDRFIGTKYNDVSRKIYEGEMILVKELWYKHGKGKSFHRNGKVEYDGTWEEDRKSQHGSLYHSDGVIKYSGHFKNDKLHGYGEKFDLCGKLLSKGEWNESKLNDVYISDEYQKLAYNTKKYDNGDIYVGNIVEGKRNGFAVLYNVDTGIIRKEGMYKNDKTNGFIKFYNTNPNHQVLHYSGHWVGGKAHHRIAFYNGTSGKLDKRVIFEDHAESPNRFGIFFNENGLINIKKSYKGNI